MADKTEFHQTIQSEAQWRRFDLYAGDELVLTRTLPPRTMSSITYHTDLPGEWRLESRDIEYVAGGRHILKRTITEEYEYDPAKLRVTFHDDFVYFRADKLERNTHRIPPLELTEEELFAWFVIELFERHDGSPYGDELFGQVDMDSGIELLTRAEDD